MKSIQHKQLSGELGAVEFLFPLDLAVAGGNLAVLENAAEIMGLTGSDASAALEKRFASISSAEVRPFLALFEGCEPYSVMTFEARSWIVLKRSGRFSEETQFGNSFIVPSKPAELRTNGIPGFDFSGAPFALEFLNQFGGLCLNDPPDSTGMVWPDHLGIADPAGWEGLGEWVGSLPIYLPGNGDLILMRADGSAGYWSHEWISPDAAPSGWLKSLGITELDRSGMSDSAVEDLHANIVDAVAMEISGCLKYNG